PGTGDRRCARARPRRGAARRRDPRRRAGRRARHGRDRRLDQTRLRRRHDQPPLLHELTNEAVIVSTARTPIAKAYRGAFNDTEAPVLDVHVIRSALAQEGVDGAAVDAEIHGQTAQHVTHDYHLTGLYNYCAAQPEIVSRRYGISRAAQDDYALRRQQRTAAAQQASLFDDEIVPLPSTKLLYDKQGQVTGSDVVTLARDEGNRADTTLESLAALKPV